VNPGLRDGRPLAAAITAACLLLAAGGFSEALEFDRAHILDGAWWRIFTGQLCHFGAGHLAMNLLGVWLLVILFRDIRLTAWIWIALASASAVGAGLLLEPEPLASYRGLSGLLYGWTAGAAVLRGARQRPWLLVPVLLGVSVVLEMAVGTGTRAVLEGVPVHATAHLYGLTGGVLAGAVLALSHTLRSRRGHG